MNFYHVPRCHKIQSYLLKSPSSFYVLASLLRPSSKLAIKGLRQECGGWCCSSDSSLGWSVIFSSSHLSKALFQPCELIQLFFFHPTWRREQGSSLIFLVHSHLNCGIFGLYPLPLEEDKNYKVLIEFPPSKAHLGECLVSFPPICKKRKTKGLTQVKALPNTSASNAKAFGGSRETTLLGLILSFWNS